MLSYSSTYNLIISNVLPKQIKLGLLKLIVIYITDSFLHNSPLSMYFFTFILLWLVYFLLVLVLSNIQTWYAGIRLINFCIKLQLRKVICDHEKLLTLSFIVLPQHFMMKSF